MSEPFVYDDTTEDARLVIERNSLGITLHTTDAVFIPPCDLARVVTGMYEAAGQPVPDLPQIFHPQQVSEFAQDLACLFDGSLTHEEISRRFLAAGWRKS